MTLAGSQAGPNTWHVRTLAFSPGRRSIVERLRVPGGVSLAGGTMDWEDLVTVKEQAMPGRDEGS